MALLLLTVVRGDLLRDWRASLPPDAPNQFLVNVLPEQVDDARAWLANDDRRRRRSSSPMVRGRLVELNGKPLDTTQVHRDARAPARRARVQPVVDRPDCRRAIASSSGKFWTPQARGADAGISLEDGIAETLGVKLGDRLTFDIAGITRHRDA